MSIRTYSGPHAENQGHPKRWQIVVPWVLVGVTILGQIFWVLVSGQGRVWLTALTVVTFFLACAWHATIYRGAWWAAGYVAISMGVGFAAEAVGLVTQFPFGDYRYSDALGPAVLGVPILIPLAWAMMSYPCLLAARRLATSTVWVAVCGAALLAGWDFFLDPQMVGEGYWVWETATPALPGIPGIPLQNFLGWYLTAFVLMFLLDRLPNHARPEAIPNTLLIWTYLSSILASAVFFGRPIVALWGAVAMGIIMVPWAWKLWSQPDV